MKTIAVDYAKRCGEEPDKGHNRWHPDIPPVVEVAEGEEVELQTRDAFDGQFSAATTPDSMRGVDLTLVHPLTGPVYVKGAEPGDLLQVEVLKIQPDKWGYTVQVPGFGYLRDLFPDPYIAKWAIKDGFAQSPDLPGVRIPDGSFMGTIGIAPSRKQLTEWTAREAALMSKGGFVLPPEAAGAVPATKKIAVEALRTIPPRENGGNMDIKQLSAGARLQLPVSVNGALFSAGDAHFAQGDSECCGTAIEMRASLLVRFKVMKGEAARRKIKFPRIERDDYFYPPELAAPKQFVATVGMCIRDDGVNESENSTLAARNALIQMIELLMERGWSRQQAYAICSVAADLRISQMVDVPNFVVTALLPLGIFGSSDARPKP